MEQSPKPQIHEQIIDDRAEMQTESSTAKAPLSDVAKKKLEKRMVTLLEDIKTARTDGAKSKEEYDASIDQFDILLKELTGENVEELEKNHFEIKAFEEIYKLLRRGVDPVEIIDCMAGLDSKAAWRIREEVYARGTVFPLRMALSMAGIDNERSWEIRREIISSSGREDVIEGLAGIDSEEAWEIREAYSKEGNCNIARLAGSLAGLTSARSWQMRRELAEESKYGRNFVLVSLVNLDTPEAWEFRTTICKDCDLNYLAQSLTGLDTEQAWRMRDELWPESTRGNTLIMSLANVDSERAWQIRNRLLGGTGDNPSFAKSLAGLDSEPAWQMRKRMEELRFSPALLALSINGEFTNAIGWRAAKGLLPYQLDKPKS